MRNSPIQSFLWPDVPNFQTLKLVALCIYCTNILDLHPLLLPHASWWLLQMFNFFLPPCIWLCENGESELQCQSKVLYLYGPTKEELSSWISWLLQEQLW